MAPARTAAESLADIIAHQRALEVRLDRLERAVGQVGMHLFAVSGSHKVRASGKRDLADLMEPLESPFGGI